MKLYYYKDPHGNFGDDINAWLWDRLLPGCWNDNDGTTMSGIGTIIGQFMPRSKRWIVFGSGTGYSTAPADFGGKNWQIVAVRGPMTARALNLPEDKAVTDGAILLALLPECKPTPVEQRHGLVFMPHHKALRFGRWPEVCRAAGVEFIDPRADSRQTLERLRTAKLVLADAMHAAIVADTLRVPWIPLTVSTETNSFKWLDWTMSVGLPYAPVPLPCSSLLENLQSAAMVRAGASHALAALSIEQALGHYHGPLQKRETFWAPNSRRAINLALKLAKFLARSPGIKSRYLKADNRQFHKAVAAMQAAMEQKSYLSDDEKFMTLKNEMQARMETVRQLVVTGE